MQDISLCRREDCKIKKKCKRYLKEANPLHQSFIKGSGKKDCSFFIKYKQNNMKKLKAMMSSNDNTWATPQSFFDKLNNEFKFTLDPCATKETAKCKKYYTKKEDGLIQDWKGETVFCNPPYGREIKHWVKKCSDEVKKGVKVVMLIPARTDTIYFHEYIYNKTEIRFIKGRIKFLINNKETNSAPFPSMVVIF